MTDRIADPWGSPTPYARGGEWPVRVDGFLQDGVTAAEVERWVPSASILHSNGDALDIAVSDGWIVGVRCEGPTRCSRSSHPRCWLPADRGDDLRGDGAQLDVAVVGRRAQQGERVVRIAPVLAHDDPDGLVDGGPRCQRRLELRGQLALPRHPAGEGQRAGSLRREALAVLALGLPEGARPTARRGPPDPAGSRRGSRSPAVVPAARRPQ